MAPPPPANPQFAKSVAELGETCRQLAKQARGLADGSGAGPDGARLAQQLFAAAGHLSAAWKALSKPCEAAPVASLPPAPPAPAASMHGSSRDLPLTELLGALVAERRSGQLRLVAGAETYDLEFLLGDVVQISCDPVPAGLRFSEILLTMGAVERAQLESFLRAKRDQVGDPRLITPAFLRQALEADGLVTRETLGQALEFQVQELLRKLLASGESSFSFRELQPLPGDARVRSQIASLLAAAQEQRAA